MKIEAVDGFIRLENDNEQAIWISEANAWEVLEFLYARRDRLYASAYNIPYEPKPRPVSRLRDFTQEHYQEFADHRRQARLDAYHANEEEGPMNMAENTHVEALRAALEQQRKYEQENWPFEGRQDGESITYHLASLYCWSPDYVLSLPTEKRDERLREIWRSFSIAGDIIKRYEDATVALLATGPQVAASGEPLNSTELKATLLIGDHLIYQCATPDDDNLPIQASWDGPYQGIVVGVNEYTAEVRKDGWGGSQPLYRVLYGHILQVNGVAKDGE